MVFLSLYLLLLAVFILLSSLGEFSERRVRSTLDGLSATFPQGGAAEISRPSPFISDLGGALGMASAFFEHVDGLVRTLVPLADIKRDAASGDMFISLPVAALFPTGRADLLEGAQSLIETLAAAEAELPPGLQLETRLLLGQGSIDGDMIYPGDALAVARVSTFARALADQGISEGAGAGAILAGIDDESPARLRLFMHVRNIDAVPVVPFSSVPDDGGG